MSGCIIEDNLAGSNLWSNPNGAVISAACLLTLPTGRVPAKFEEELKLAIVAFSRYSGGKRDAIVPLAKQSKGFYEKVGAEWFRLSQIHTGPHAGQWLVSIRWPDWATYGNGQQALAGDVEHQKLLAEVGALIQLQDRTIVVSVDL
jgi:hypothetical protein